MSLTAEKSLRLVRASGRGEAEWASTRRSGLRSYGVVGPIVARRVMPGPVVRFYSCPVFWALHSSVVLCLGFV